MVDYKDAIEGIRIYPISEYSNGVKGIYIDGRLTRITDDAGDLIGIENIVSQEIMPTLKIQKPTEPISKPKRSKK